MNGASSFDGADGEASRICEAAHNSCLPLERAGDGLVDGCGVGEVDHVDVTLGGCYDKQLILNVHAVDALLASQSTNGLGALEIPELNSLVPGASRDVVLAAGLEPANALDAVLVSLGLLRRDGAAGGGSAEVDNVEHACRVAGCYTGAILIVLVSGHDFPTPC